MSVTFYDPSNIPVYDNDGDKVGGGLEVNFSNVNAANILQLMGFDHESGLYGEASGDDFRKSIGRGLAYVYLLVGHKDEYMWYEIKHKLFRLQTVFEEALLVRWE
jgi:hypothetical protein